MLSLRFGHVPSKTCSHDIEETVHILSWISQWST